MENEQNLEELANRPQLRETRALKLDEILPPTPVYQPEENNNAAYTGLPPGAAVQDLTKSSGIAIEDYSRNK
jgi:hypothetical protein